MTDLINRRTGKTAQLHRSKKFELIFVCKVVYLRFGCYIETSYLLIKGGKRCRNLKSMI